MNRIAALTDCSTADPAFVYHLKLASVDELKSVISQAEQKAQGQVVRLKLLHSRLRRLERETSKAAR